MLFLLRNIRRKLLGSKVASYLLYAIGEIILVVVGILIAIQLEGWKEEHEKKQKEEKILIQIHKDFLSNAEQFKSINRDHKNVFQSADWLLNHMPFNTNSASLDSIQLHLGRTFKVSTFDPSLASIQALINTSSFDLISNDSLRNLIVGWKDIVEDYNEEEYAAKDAFNERYVPYFMDKKPFQEIVGIIPLKNLDGLSSVTFENNLFERRILSYYILLESDKVEDYMEKIIRMTESQE